MLTESVILKGHSAVNAYSSGTSGKAIVFVHGNSSNALMWRTQLRDAALAAQYRLLAFDLPGHGLSERTSDYGMQALAAYIPALVAAMDIAEYVLVAISYGTCLVGEAAPILPGCRGVMAVSPNLTSNKVLPGVWLNPFPEAMAMGAPMVDDDTLSRFARRMVYTNEAIASEYIDSYKHTDPDFRVAVGKTIMSAGWTDELENLRALHVPVAVVFGKHEQMIHTNYMDGFPPLWRQKSIHVEDAAHLVNAEQPNAFNAVLAEFAADVFK